MSAKSVSSPPAWQISFDQRSRIKAAVVGMLFVGVFWKLLDFNPIGGFGDIVHRWVYEWRNWSHCAIIPLFSAYLVYLRWDKIKRCPVRHTWPGFALLLCGLALYQYALWGLPIHYLQPLAMMVCLLGVIVSLCGLAVMRYAWLPYVYLLFAIPIPHRYYFMLTDPLQRLAASATCAVLTLFPGLEVERAGTIIDPILRGVPLASLSVTDACSGMRGTMVLCALGVAVAFMAWRPWWHRVILLAACVPIATLCNVTRVTTTCLLHIYVDPKYASGVYHETLGLLLFLSLGAAMFLGLAWALNNLLVEEPEPEAPADGT